MKIKNLFLALCSAIGCFIISGCGEKGGDEFIDYVNDGSVRLIQNYEGKSFWRDGVEKVTLKTCIDGDTVHFNTPSNSSKVLKARFYGVDTPESTGQIQPFGKQASNFTKEKIKNADENGTIVISSPRRDYGIPSADSTGERYVSLVWINETKKNAPKNELILLNLALVQEGFSWVKNTDDFPEYSSTFDKACLQAEKFKKGLFSDEPDPLYNYGGYEDVSLLEIKRAVIAHLNDASVPNIYDGAKLRVTGTVCGMANHILYIQDFYSHEDFPDLVGEAGEYAGLNVFTGMGSIPADFYTPGAYVQLCGTCTDSENFGFQMSGVSFKMVPFDDNDAQIIYYADENTEKQLTQFDYTKAQFDSMISSKDYDKIYCAVSCTDTLECTRCYMSTDGTEFTLYFKDTDLQAYITFPYTPYADHKNVTFSSEADYTGKQFKVKGIYVPHKTQKGKMNFQINPVDSTYLECMTPYTPA